MGQLGPERGSGMTATVQHYAVDTGHVREMSRSEVEDDVVRCVFRTDVNSDFGNT